MFVKKIKFTDYNGNAREEDFYFNLNEAELAKMEMRTPGGMSAMLERIVQKLDGQQIIDTFEELINLSYGEKSPDGREFVKSPEITRKFMQTEAYNKFFMELCTDSEAASQFFNAIVPQRAEAETKDVPNPPVLTAVQ